MEITHDGTITLPNNNDIYMTSTITTAHLRLRNTNKNTSWLRLPPTQSSDHTVTFPNKSGVLATLNDLNLNATTTSVILPFAFGKIIDANAGTGTGLSWDAFGTTVAKYNIVTFDTPQSNSSYSVVSDCEVFDDGKQIHVFSKTVNGFRVQYWDGSSAVSSFPSEDNFTIIVYGSTPTVDIVGSTLDVINDLTPQLGGNLDTNDNTFITTNNKDIKFEPNGSGNINIIDSDIVFKGTNSGESVISRTSANNLLIKTTDSSQIRLLTSNLQRFRILGSGIVEIMTYVSSTSTNTGALIVEGGVGIQENCHIGGIMNAKQISLNGSLLKGDANELNTYILCTFLDDISSISSCFVVAPKNGVITKIYSVKWHIICF